MLHEESDENPAQTNSFSDSFIEEFLLTQKAKIETRKLIQEMLLFISCQVASASLATILFQFAVQVVFTTWLCLFVAWIPSLSSLSEVHFQKTEEGWTLHIMNRPVTTIIKFVSAVGIVTASIYSTANEINQTNQAITSVYREITQYEKPQTQNFLPPYLGQILLASVAIVCLVAFVRSIRNGNPFD
ncbi:MAG TPA: hypothetical protein V6D11_12340 [Waterburya sp.]|jgi:hypothetical protein